MRRECWLNLAGQKGHTHNNPLANWRRQAVQAPSQAVRTSAGLCCAFATRVEAPRIKELLARRRRSLSHYSAQVLENRTKRHSIARCSLLWCWQDCLRQPSVRYSSPGGGGRVPHLPARDSRPNRIPFLILSLTASVALASPPDATIPAAPTWRI